ncbi:MAG: hypothetical protein ACREXP_20755 [Steroidobacteraceae bacterium]
MHTIAGAIHAAPINPGYLSLMAVHYALSCRRQGWLLLAVELGQELVVTGGCPLVPVQVPRLPLEVDERFHRHRNASERLGCRPNERQAFLPVRAGVDALEHPIQLALESGGVQPAACGGFTMRPKDISRQLAVSFDDLLVCGDESANVATCALIVRYGSID